MIKARKRYRLLPLLIGALLFNSCNSVLLTSGGSQFDENDPEGAPLLTVPETILNGKFGETRTLEFKAQPWSESHHSLTIENLPSSATLTSSLALENGIVVKHFSLSWSPTTADSPEIYRLTIEASNQQGPTSSQKILLSSEHSDDDAARTLVLANQNVASSLTIAQYYADQRGISPNHICSVGLPAGHYAKFEQVVAARKTILENCICPLIPVSVRPAPCDVQHAEEIAAVSPISTLVSTRGIPQRILNFTDTNWTSDISWGAEDPSLLYMLSRLLYWNFSFPLQTPLSTSISMDYHFPISPFYGIVPAGFYNFSLSEVPWQPGIQTKDYPVRRILPRFDRLVAYGHIEAMTVDRTLELIDRTLESENAGLSGKTIFQSAASLPSDVHYPLVCRHFSEAQQLNQCNVTLAQGGFVPGDPSSNLTQAVDTGLYLGAQVALGHTAFDGFSNMLKWRKQAAACTPLCKDLATAPLRTACRNNSTDFFQELNTDCVGVAQGFMGHQVRSWPVQYYGFYPPGWGPNSGGNGSYERVPPVLQLKDASEVPVGVIDHYAHFGPEHEVANAQCPDVNGQVVACPSFITIDLLQGLSLASYPAVASDNFPISFQLKNTASPGGTLYVKYSLYSGSTLIRNGTQIISMSVARPTFQTVTVNASPAQAAGITSITLHFQALEGNLLRGGIVGIDSVEVKRPDGTTIPMTNGDFESPVIYNSTQGDWAANVIDRLNGIAWWGSSSHFYTGGLSFAADYMFLRALMSGRTLGESLLAEGGRAISGIIYGDPLYRPVASRVHVSAPGTSAPPESSPTLPLVLGAPAENNGVLYVDAMYGTRPDVTWQLWGCLSSDCDTGNTWVLLREMNRSVRHYAVELANQNLFTSELPGTGLLALKLRVHPTGEPSKAVFHKFWLQR